MCRIVNCIENAMQVFVGLLYELSEYKIFVFSF